MMDSTEHTCWTMIHRAADGDAEQRDAFARRYSDVIRAYLAARWRHSPLFSQVDDAVQEVFVECYREDGALGRVSSDRPGGFRAYLYGVVRNVARRIESIRSRRREVQPDSLLEEEAESDGHLSQVFDRSWAKAIMWDAAVRMAELAADAGKEAQRRVELLRLRFQEGLPIRDIAERWNVDAVHLHRQYALARADFKVALVDVLGFYESARNRTSRAKRPGSWPCWPDQSNYFQRKFQNSRAKTRRAMNQPAEPPAYVRRDGNDECAVRLNQWKVREDGRG